MLKRDQVVVATEVWWIKESESNVIANIKQIFKENKFKKAAILQNEEKKFLSSLCNTCC